MNERPATACCCCCMSECDTQRHMKKESWSRSLAVLPENKKEAIMTNVDYDDYLGHLSNTETKKLHPHQNKRNANLSNAKRVIRTAVEPDPRKTRMLPTSRAPKHKIKPHNTIRDHGTKQTLHRSERGPVAKQNTFLEGQIRTRQMQGKETRPLALPLSVRLFYSPPWRATNHAPAPIALLGLFRITFLGCLSHNPPPAAGDARHSAQVSPLFRKTNNRKNTGQLSRAYLG